MSRCVRRGTDLPDIQFLLLLFIAGFGFGDARLDRCALILVRVSRLQFAQAFSEKPEVQDSRDGVGTVHEIFS